MNHVLFNFALYFIQTICESIGGFAQGYHPCHVKQQLPQERAARSTH